MRRRENIIERQNLKLQNKERQKVEFTTYRKKRRIYNR